MSGREVCVTEILLSLPLSLSLSWTPVSINPSDETKSGGGPPCVRVQKDHIRTLTDQSWVDYGNANDNPARTKRDMSVFKMLKLDTIWKEIRDEIIVNVKHTNHNFC